MSLDVSPKSLVYYEARVVFGVMALVPTLLIPAFGMLLAVYRPGEIPPLPILGRVFEMALPLAAGLSAAHLMNIEREEHFAELRGSYPEASLRIPLLRTAGALCLLVLTVLIGLLSFVILFNLSDFASVVLPALPPAIFLTALVLLVSNLTGSTWITAALLVGYWFFEYQQRGRVTQTLFLFDKSFPLPSVSYDLNRGLLLGLGVLCMALNALVSVIRRGRTTVE